MWWLIGRTFVWVTDGCRTEFPTQPAWATLMESRKNGRCCIKKGTQTRNMWKFYTTLNPLGRFRDSSPDCCEYHKNHFCFFSQVSSSPLSHQSFLSITMSGCLATGSLSVYLKSRRIFSLFSALKHTMSATWLSCSV